MKKTLAITAIIAALAIASIADAEGKKDPSWTFQVGYSPMAAGGISSEADTNGAGDFSLIGGSISFDWRSDGRWGIHIPVSVHKAPKIKKPVVSVGANAILHFRKRGKKFDPYLLLGGKALIGAHGRNVAVIPMPSVGLGVRGYISKNVGLYAEVSGQRLPAGGLMIGVAQGIVGVSIRF